MDERIKELLQYFQQCLQDTDHNSSGLLGAAKATYPLMVVSLGKKTEEALGCPLKRQLLKMWPPYKDSLLFLTVEGFSDNLQFSLMESATQISDEEVQNRVSSLFEEDSYFLDFNRLLVFYLLDTSTMEENMDLKEYLNMIESCKNVFAFSAQNSILFLTINERVGHEKQAACVRNDFAKLYFQTGEAKKLVPCTYLISNKNVNGSYMQKQNSYFDRILSDIILLCSSRNPYVSSSMLYDELKTVGYTTQAKPVEDIAKVSVSSLLKKISDLQNSNKKGEHQLEEHNMDDILLRLGIQKDGTFYMLDPYVKSVSRYLPTQEELDAFPRRTCEDLDLLSLSVDEMEEETFGSWGCYIENIVSRIEEEIVSDFQKEDSFQNAYKKYLQENFSRNELIWMSKNPEEIQNLLDQTRIPYGQGNVIDSLKRELSVSIFKNSGIKETIIHTIVQTGKEAHEFTRMWNNMVNTESLIVSIKNTIPFYDHIVQQYIDRNSSKILEKFQTISDMHSLKEFLFGEIRSLIKSNPIFRASFVDELIARVNQNEPEQALRAIADRLCGNNVKIWLGSNGNSLNDPIQRAVLMQDGTDLYTSLHETLPEDKYYYYDTDINESADALDVYVLDEFQLSV